MSTETDWYTIEMAVTKFKLDTSLILKWAEEGTIGAELNDTRSMRVNVNELEFKLQFLKKYSQSFIDCD